MDSANFIQGNFTLYNGCKTDILNKFAKII